MGKIVLINLGVTLVQLGIVLAFVLLFGFNSMASGFLLATIITILIAIAGLAAKRTNDLGLHVFGIAKTSALATAVVVMFVLMMNMASIGHMNISILIITPFAIIATVFTAIMTAKFARSTSEYPEPLPLLFLVALPLGIGIAIYLLYVLWELCDDRGLI